MGSIKAIEGRSIHHIQSGQVIVDLTSVIKELVENSLDAGASSIDVRFKNHGLEAVEVQDNGCGISVEDYETIALKHYTSKLSSYEDLDSLQTFGFRGEALSSMCALSRFHIVTAQDGEAPKGTRLDFETSGKLKSTTVAACPKGTSVSVEDLFNSLPVRRRELEKNIKREYGKVLTILHAYACISTGVKFTVSNQMAKGKKAIVFSTKSNSSTKDNIANVFGARLLSSLVALDLSLELQPTTTRSAVDGNSVEKDPSRKVHIFGHVSRPIFGEGRQTPDRQMFYVNSRPCGLPQIAKAFNEVYKSYNLTQSPFIFANLVMDTNAYDVNVSPDKRSIMLHDQSSLLEALKQSLTDLFDAQEQTVPQSQISVKKLSAFKPLSINREPFSVSESGEGSDLALTRQEDERSVVEADAPSQDDPIAGRGQTESHGETFEDAQTAVSHVEITNQSKFPRQHATDVQEGDNSPISDQEGNTSDDHNVLSQSVRDFNAQLTSLQTNGKASNLPKPIEIPTISVVHRSGSTDDTETTSSKRLPSKTSMHTATFPKQPVTSSEDLELPPNKRRKAESTALNTTALTKKMSGVQFSQRMHMFSAPGEQQEIQQSRQQMYDLEELASDSDEESVDGRGVLRYTAEEEGLEASHSDASPSSVSQGLDSSDGEYLDEEQRRQRDTAQVEELVRQAEEVSARPPKDQRKRALNLLSRASNKDSVVNVEALMTTSTEDIRRTLQKTRETLAALRKSQDQLVDVEDVASSQTSAEERLSLTITKSDFLRMRIVGQFNLGFILATRTAALKSSVPSLPSLGTHQNAQELKRPSTKDLFIIDQHASDEIYNFSRLSKTTTLTPQPLVRPYPLELTAIEEDTILDHIETLDKNGFKVSFDDSGNSPVGQRCHLLTLPTSRETIFDPQDLEELITLVGDATPAAGEVIRPSKVRKMLAMRACRSSVMVGKELSLGRMEDIMRHMAQIERPWNCPHGRPTMRHLAGLGEWQGWREGGGLVDEDESEGGGAETDWPLFLRRTRQGGLMSTEDSEIDQDQNDEDEDEEVGDVI